MARKSKKPAELSTLFNKTSGTLAQINQKTNSINKIADIVRQICPDLPAESWHIANFSNNKVIIEVGSSIWGQRLQFEKNQIANQLNIETEGAFNQVELKVNPYFNKAKTNLDEQEKPKKSISVKTAEQLTEIAKSAPPSLKEKLERLAKIQKHS